MMRNPVFLKRNTVPAAAHRGAQGGAAAVEFALVLAFAFLPLLLGILEFGRLFYVADMAQEVTRRAARTQVVRWASESAAVRREAVLQCGDRYGLSRAELDCRQAASTVNLPGSPEIADQSVALAFFHSYEDARAERQAITGVDSPEDNLNRCLRDREDPDCILYVRASLDQLVYRPLSGAFGAFLAVPLPAATVIMPAESLGLR